MLTNRRYDRGQFVLVAPAGGTLDQDRRQTREQDDPIPCCRYAESRKHQPDSSQPDEDGKTERAIIAAGISPLVGYADIGIKATRRRTQQRALRTLEQSVGTKGLARALGPVDE